MGFPGGSDGKGDPSSIPVLRRSPGEGIGYPDQYSWASLVAQMVKKKKKKKSSCNVGDLSSVPGLRSSPGGGHGNPLQYSCLENPMVRGAWSAAVHGVAKSRTRLRDFTFNYTCSGVFNRLLVRFSPKNLASSRFLGALPCFCRSR